MTDKPRLSIALDYYGEPCVWERHPDRPDAPWVVLSSFDVHDDNLWNAIVDLVNTGGVR